ncbi:hypothetical protein ACWCQS_21305 [Streptomyces sp. NPDC002076]
MLGDGHAGFGGRAGETHREQSRQGAPVRPNNLAEAVEKTVVRHRALLREPGHKATPMAPPTDRAELEEKSLAEPRTSGRLSDRVRRQHATVHQLLDKGMALRAIACELRLSRTTVRRLAHATTQTSCWSVNGRAAPASWTPTSPNLHQRWAEGRTNATRLFGELQERGYRGGITIVREYVRRLRDVFPHDDPPRKDPSVRDATA